MIRKIFSIITAISIIALLAMGESPRHSVAAQTGPVNGSQRALPAPRVVLDINDMELFAPNSMRVGWTAKKIGLVTIDRYTITLTLSRSGVTERVGAILSGGATSASVDLRGISAANRAKLFGPNLRVTAILKADCTGKTGGVSYKFVSEIQERKSFGGNVASPIEK